MKYIKLTVFLAVFAATVGVPSLHAEWTEDGIPLGAASGAQDSPAITADGSGGAVIVWTDSRATVNTDIYAQGITADGVIRWYPSGMAVCTASNSQSKPMVIPDGTGGTIIAWQDSRTGGSVDIYVQKLSSIGYIQWPADGVALCTGQTGLILCGIVSDGAGGAIVTWYDRRNFFNDIFAQRIASNGSVMWTANGVPVCTAAEHQQNPSIASDGAGGAIIAWQDRRSGAYDIYAQRLDATGTVRWTADGIVICDSGQIQTFPQVVEDGSGGAIIAWSDRRNTMDFDIFAQRVNSDGTLQWGFGTPVSAWMYDQEECRLVHLGSGVTVVTWKDERSGTSIDIYSQKLDAAGVVQWAINGVAVCSAPGSQDNIKIANNNSGGAFIAWADERDGASDVDIYAQNITSGGSPAWTADGIVICDAIGNQYAEDISADGASGIFIAWTDGRDGTDKIYNHRVNADGNIPTATLLYNYSAELEGKDIRIDWILSEIDEGVVFSILRSTDPRGMFEEITSADYSEDGLSFTFIDNSCRPGVNYFYRIVYSDAEESGILFEIGPITTPAMEMALHQNRPNPFNPRTVIGYYLPETCKVRLEVFDVAGRSIKVLANSTQGEGDYSIDWDGRDSNGALTGSGVYFYRLTAGKTTLSRKMVLLR